VGSPTHALETIALETIALETHALETHALETIANETIANERNVVETDVVERDVVERSAPGRTDVDPAVVAAPVRSLSAVLARFWLLTRPTVPAARRRAAADRRGGRRHRRRPAVHGPRRRGRRVPDDEAYWVPAGTWVGVALVGAVTTAAGSYLSACGAERFLLRVRDLVFAHRQRLGPDFVQRHPPGDLVARLSGDVETIEALVSFGLVGAAASLVTVALFAGAAFWLRWDLALVVAALVPLLSVLTRCFSALMSRTPQEERRGNGAVSSAAEERVATVGLAQAYGAESRHARRLHTACRGWMRARLAEMRLASVYPPLTDLLEVLVVIAVLGFGAWDGPGWATGREPGPIRLARASLPSRA
jgi:ABC-type multidrug transport system fused ATPase/permease subunit